MACHAVASNGLVLSAMPQHLGRLYWTDQGDDVIIPGGKTYPLALGNVHLVHGPLGLDHH